ncbi:MAG: deoxyribonuclease IV [Oxalobacter sp.]|nr:deoxyribonuclease IV [Oxalobacter sp.]
MYYIGCHLSSSKGMLAMGREALSIGANTFQFFTRNPRGGKAKALDVADCEALNELMAKNQFGPVIAHAPYTLNMAAKDEGLRKFAMETVADDMMRLSYTPTALYNIHPGSHVGQGSGKGIELITTIVSQILDMDGKTPLLLETMSGKGSEVGRSFEEIQTIIANCGNHPRLGVCLDTCHVWSAGYDIVGNIDDVITQFDRIIGLDRLKAIHLNDSMTPFASNKDRHALIGQGSIGLDAIVRVITHPKLSHLPFCLETPNDIPGYQQEIALLRSLAEKAPN